MITANMHEAKSNLSRLVAAVERGEHVRLMRGGVPVADLVPVSASPGDAAGSPDRFSPHPWRGTVSGSFFDDPTQPLSPDEWPEEFR